MPEPDSKHQAWLAQLRRRADLPALAARVALITGAPPLRIGSVEASLAARMRRAGLPLQPRGRQWQVLPPLDASLAAIAQWLNANGITGPWRNELLAVTDEQQRTLGAIERCAVRPLGVTTFAVHLVAARADGRVWVQQRSQDKAIDPGLWDTTMGGQVGADESTAQALERETWEESGLRIAQLQELREAGRITFRRPVTEGYLVEHIDVFEATLDDAVLPVNQDGEVQSFECLPPDELLRQLQAENFTLEAAIILVAWLRRRGLV